MSKHRALLVDTKLTLLPEFNLSLLRYYADEYRKDETGKLIKNQPILQPLEWLHLDETQEFLYSIFKCEHELNVAMDTIEDNVNNIYTDRFAVYLAYIQYCFGENLPQIINNNLWV